MEPPTSSLSQPSRHPLARFAQQPRHLIWLETTLLALLVGYLDYTTGYELSLTLFYSVPILLMVWYADRRSAVLMALLCALIWWWADIASGHPYSSVWYQVWETIVRLMIYLTFVFVGGEAKARIHLLERSRQLEREIIRISEREQRRIGQDLHDGLCQYYAAVGCAAGSLRMNLEKTGSAAAPAAAEIEDMIKDGITQARGLARGLSPVEGHARGLQYALQELVDQSGRLLNLECVLVASEHAAVFDADAANHLYRVAQEAINNAHRHGKASRIEIKLQVESEWARLTITDNGVGLPHPIPENAGMGLSVMQYRMRMAGGQWRILRLPESGTMVECLVPQKQTDLLQP